MVSSSFLCRSTKQGTLQQPTARHWATIPFTTSTSTDWANCGYAPIRRVSCISTLLPILHATSSFTVSMATRLSILAKTRWLSKTSMASFGFIPPVVDWHGTTATRTNSFHSTIPTFRIAGAMPTSSPPSTVTAKAICGLAPTGMGWRKFHSANTPSPLRAMIVRHLILQATTFVQSFKTATDTSGQEAKTVWYESMIPTIILWAIFAAMAMCAPTGKMHWAWPTGSCRAAMVQYGLAPRAMVSLCSHHPKTRPQTPKASPSSFVSLHRPTTISTASAATRYTVSTKAQTVESGWPPSRMASISWNATNMEFLPVSSAHAISSPPTPSSLVIALVSSRATDRVKSG